MNTFYVTTPIYYVNDKPHIGHAYTSILADVLTRYHRLRGGATYFLTGTDEHGQKVQAAARERGIPPRQHVDEMVVHFQDMLKAIGASNDDYIRTTEERHTKVVQACLQALYDKGEIYKQDYEGWYCEADEMFVAEEDLVDGKSPSGRPVELIKESNYFFRMGQYQDWLIEYIESNPGFIRPATRANETLGFLKKQKLEDLCISRPKARLEWGIPLPFDDDYVTYVWFDALVNYISAIGYGDPASDFATRWPAVHIIGKDILTTHTVYWPTMLKALGLEQPRAILAHGWWVNEAGKKESKTGGAGPTDPAPFIEAFGADAWRYHMIAEMRLGHDAPFSERGFAERYNAELVNDLGNLASRVIKLMAREFDGKVPEVDVSGSSLKASAAAAVTAYQQAFESDRPDQAVAAVMALVRESNGVFNEAKPWDLAKSGDKDALAASLVAPLEVLRVVSILLQPVIPEKSKALRDQFGFGDREPSLAAATEWGVIPAGTAVSPDTLFPRMKWKPKDEDTDKKPAAAAAAPPVGVATPDMITYDEFKKVQLRTGKISKAERVEGADKLLKLQVYVGDEIRQLVAGIAQYYEPEELQHKVVIVVCNLKPATIRGIESNGMILAASKGSSLKLVTVDGGQMSSGADVR